MGKHNEFPFSPCLISFQNNKLQFLQMVVLDNLFSVSSLSVIVTASHAVRRIPRILAFAVALVFAFSPVKADAFDWLLEDSLTTMSSCGTSFDGTLSTGTSCVLDSGVNLMLKKSMDSANEYGKKAFGKNFRFFGDLTYQSGTGFINDLDVVIPLAFTESLTDRKARSSLFLQQGITRWRDSEGDSRDDLRFGVAYRFRLTDEPDSDVVGLSAFSLHSAEWGHQVLASRMDYAGRWGTGSLTYFLPATSWLSTDPGYEERALEGMELGLNLKLTTTVRANLTAYRWQAEDGSGEWKEGARLGVDWRPHPWLNFTAGYDGIGGGKASSSFLARVSVPIGGSSRPKPRWEGLGGVARNEVPSVFNLWRPVDKIGRIKVARRIETSTLANRMSVRPLRNSIVSGEMLQVKLSLPVVAPEDVRVRVRLAPGGGANPAVAGIDFHDGIVEATIREGARDTVVSLPLIRNDDMRKPRSLRIIKVSQNSPAKEIF